MQINNYYTKKMLSHTKNEFGNNLFVSEDCWEFSMTDIDC